MSSDVGTGVASTVVFIDAVETGPTNKSHRSSQVSTIEEVNAVGLGTVVVPLDSLRLIEAVGVGTMEDESEAL
jgi:hypothetical protein